MVSRSVQRRLQQSLKSRLSKKEFMGKVLEFKKKLETEPNLDVNTLTEEEIGACAVAKVLRDNFTDAQVEAIRADLEAEGEN